MKRILTIFLAVIVSVVFSQPVMAAETSADRERITQEEAKGDEPSILDMTYSLITLEANAFRNTGIAVILTLKRR